MTIVLQGGRVIDPANLFDAIADVAVDDGVIAAVGADIAADFPEADVVNCSGLVVTPGLIDLHAHVFPGLGDFCLPPDRVGVDSGVPVVVDGGTSGATTFEVSRHAYVDHPETRTRVLCFMDPCQIYLANKGFICHHLRLADDVRNIDLDVTTDVLERNRDIIVGFKVRACHTGDPNVSPFLDAAKQGAPPRSWSMRSIVGCASTSGIPAPTSGSATRGACWTTVSCRPPSRPTSTCSTSTTPSSTCRPR
jgi:dihydroorotase